MVNNRRHAIVRADLEKSRIELVAAANIHGDGRVFEATFLKHDRDFSTVRRWPIVEIDQDCTLGGISTASKMDMQYKMFGRSPEDD